MTVGLGGTTPLPKLELEVVVAPSSVMAIPVPGRVVEVKLAVDGGPDDVDMFAGSDPELTGVELGTGVFTPLPPVEFAVVVAPEVTKLASPLEPVGRTNPPPPVEL